MKNLMAKEFTERYVEYLFSGNNTEEAATKALYYWVMCTLESIFWGFDFTMHFCVDLYVNDQEMFLMYTDNKNCKDYKFICHCYRNCYLPIVLNKLPKIFNNIDYPLSKFRDSNFYLYGFTKISDGTYKGYYRTLIDIDMYPDSDGDPCNRGYHG